MTSKKRLFRDVLDAPLYRPNGFPPQYIPIGKPPESDPSIALILFSEELPRIADIMKPFPGATIRFVALVDFEQISPGTSFPCEAPVGSLDELIREYYYLNFCAYFRNKQQIDIAHKKLCGMRIMHYYRLDSNTNIQFTEPRPDYYSQQQDQLERVYALLADDESRRVMASRIRAVLTENYGFIRPSVYEEYRFPAFTLKPGDVVIDAGVSEDVGITEYFADSVGESGLVVSLEPDPEGYVKAGNQLSRYQNIRLLPLGLLDTEKTVEFSIFPSGSSRILNAPYGREAEKKVQCRMVTLDSLVEQQNLTRIDYIKMDIEGSELPALRGAAATLRRHRPQLMISLYHYADMDAWNIVEYIHSLDLGYKIYLGHHSFALFEFVMYATTQ